MSKVAYLGLGMMGRGMAANLASAGHDVIAWNRTPRDIAELESRGVRWEPFLAATRKGADFVMYCLSDDTAVREVVLGDGGVAELADTGSVVIDLSTIDPDTSAEEAAAFAARGIRFLDAPVLGSKSEPATGGLWIVAGVDQAVFNQVIEVIKPISETVHYMGDAGNGTRTPETVPV